MCGLKNFGTNLVPYIEYGLHSDLKREFATIFFLFHRHFRPCNRQEVETGKIQERRSRVYLFLFATYSRVIGRDMQPDDGTVYSNS